MPQPKKHPRPVRLKIEANLIETITIEQQAVTDHDRLATRARTRRDTAILKLAARGWTPGDINRATGAAAERVRDLTRSTN
jgi:hypothetical protein